MINSDMRRYFAYGSNIDAVLMKKRCPQSEKQERTELSGYEFFINKRGVANIRRNKNKKVFGVVYSITKGDERKLDECEGVKYGTNTKENLPSLNAFYYLAKETNEGQPREGYLEKIIKASQSHKFPKEYITELEGWLK